MRNFQELLNRFTKGEFNYEQMGNIPEVKKRTNAILNDPRQMLLNTDANYSNMGSYVPNMPTPQEPKQPDFRVPSQMPGAYNMGVGMGPGIDHGITGNLSDIQSRPIDYGVQGGFKQMPYRYGEQGQEGIQQMPYRGGTPTLTEFGQGLEALKKAKERGVMNDSTYEALQMLQGY